MERVKESLVCKVIAFVVIQVCVVTMVFSGIIVAFNAGYGWYSADKDAVRKQILSEIAHELQLEMYDRLYYNIEWYESEYAVWHEYFHKDNPLPEGIGYNLEVLRETNHNLDSIELKKNLRIRELKGVYSEEIYNDLYRLTIYVADPLETGKPATEIYPEKQALRYQLYYTMYQFNKIAIAGFMLSLIAAIVLFVYLASSMKCRTGAKGILRMLPVDLICGIYIGVIAAVCACCADVPVDFLNYDLMVLCAAAVTFAVSVMLTLLILFFVYRVKCGKWWDNAVVVVFFRFAKRAVRISFEYIKKAVRWIYAKAKIVKGLLARCIRKVPLIWKTIVMLILFWVINLIIMVNFYWADAAGVLWMLSALLVSAAIMYIVLCMKRLQKDAGQLADGNLNYKCETKGLFWEFAEHAENLNRISDGMTAAVDERIKSERFKAELITNVSHDIKTPLTSIINYVDLLNKENIENQKICEYIEVLDRQSKRLKKLTEDLVDASKVSTGNIEIDLAPCNVGMLMAQTMGEYESRAEDNDLKLMLRLPERELEILADGRRLWRVFDNLLNNICKYAQPGTRVYLSLEEAEGKAVVIYRNVSKYELDISAEELMERFVRGDRSRHTEGSGLGLSIAKNLVEMQEGSFDIHIDGDLFKVTMKFDLFNL